MLWKGTMDRKRLMELAIESLLQQKKQIDDEIAAIQAELRGGGSAPVRAVAAAPGVRRRRSRTAAERKAQSEKMRQYWAARRAKEAGKSTAKSKRAKGKKSKSKSGAQARIGEVQKIAAAKSAS